jgi:hypothetical protein
MSNIVKLFLRARKGCVASFGRCFSGFRAFVLRSPPSLLVHLEEDVLAFGGMGSWCSKLREEFAWSNCKLDLSSQELERFGRGRSLPLIFFRINVALYLVALVAWSISILAEDGEGKYWPIYLTHWTLFFEALYFSFAAAEIILADRVLRICSAERNDGAVKLNFFVKATWVLQEVVYSGSLAIAILFWALVYDGGPVQALSVQVHGVTAILALVDVSFSNHPVRFLHVYMVQIYGLLFIIWSIIHWEADIGTDEEPPTRYIYSSLDWANAVPATIASILILLLFLPVLQLLVWTTWHFLGQGPAILSAKREGGEADVKRQEVDIEMSRPGLQKRVMLA